VLWQPEKLWSGKEAFIIGGGRSLRDFDFDLLIDEKTIGCNNAYTFGPEICNVLIFGDAKWLKVHERGVAEYVDKGGFVVTNATQLANSSLVWLHWMRRRPKGLHFDAIGWNKSTGTAAINLALLFGATTVYLLGFDRYFKKGKPNWHDHLIDAPKAQTYDGMNYADTYVKKDLAKKFPDCTVINVTDHSDLNVWPKVPFTGFWEKRRESVGCDSNESRRAVSPTQMERTKANV
jgi:hypothetical protein